MKRSVIRATHGGNMLRVLLSFFLMLAFQTTQAINLEDGLSSPYPAPAITGINAWINSKPIVLSDLKGKVVLIDFWTYSCINCIRTFPYLKNWYEKYHDKGLVIIGLHTPEFDFEKELSNIQAAVKKYGIPYPVALDNNSSTWQAYSNQYWPAHYLIDKEGNVVYEHFGEGKYDVTENNIRILLGLNKTNDTLPIEQVGTQGQTPETYLGYARAEKNLSPDNFVLDGVGNYQYPAELSANGWALQGKWNVSSEHITSASKNAKLKIKFYARKVYVVMGTSNNKTISVEVRLNGAMQSNIKVDKHRLYDALQFSSPEEGELELTATDAGLEVYTFTFG